MHELKKQASEGDEIKFSIIKKSSDAYPVRVDHEMTRRDMLDAVFKELADDLSPAKSGHGTSEGGASDTMSVRTMSFADEVAMELVIKEDDDGFPMPPTDDEKDEAMIPPPIWDHEDRKVVDQAISATPGQAVLKSGDQKTLTRLRKLGKDVSDPIKALALHHKEVQEKRRTENNMKKAATAKAQGKQPKVKNMKRKQPVCMKGKMQRKDGQVYERNLWSQARGGPSDPHKEPCNGKYYFKISKTHAMTPGKERIYFTGKENQGDKFKLIIEITKVKCAHHGKDYVDMAEYMHCLIADGNTSKEQAKIEYENALLWHA